MSVKLEVSTQSFLTYLHIASMITTNKPAILRGANIRIIVGKRGNFILDGVNAAKLPIWGTRLHIHRGMAWISAKSYSLTVLFLSREDCFV